MRRIIKQPNGKLALWSSIIDDFLILNVEKQAMIDYLVNEFMEEIEEKVDKQLNERNYLSFNSFEELIDIVKERHGKNCDTVKELKKLKLV